MDTIPNSLAIIFMLLYAFFVVGDQLPAVAFAYDDVALRRSDVVSASKASALLRLHWRRDLYSFSNTASHTTKTLGTLRSGDLVAHGNAPAPSATYSLDGRGYQRRNVSRRVRNWFIGFAVGSIAGIASGILLALAFRMLANCIRRRYRNPAGPKIFSSLIKRAEELAFLDKDDSLVGLEFIGRGACGVVYKAQLAPDPRKTNQPGRLIAIKKVVLQQAADRIAGDQREQSSKALDARRRQIRSEIRTVGQIRHRNLLPLLAHLSRPDCDLLIYEYMKNGSLEAVIRESAAGRRKFDWPARLKVARGVAAGMEYLHTQHSPRVIHRDLKTANILLDEEMEARIGDFGLAKLLPESETHLSTSRVVGTLGYIAPECHNRLRFTEKSDIYSLGVILAVLVVGKEPWHDFFQNTEEVSLLHWLRNAMASAHSPAAVVVDPNLAVEAAANPHQEQEMVLLLKIACFCTVDDPKDRPTAKDVRCMLTQMGT